MTMTEMSSEMRLTWIRDAALQMWLAGRPGTHDCVDCVSIASAIYDAAEPLAEGEGDKGGGEGEASE